MSEEWRDIPGFEGRYQASNLGRIKSLSRKVRTQRGFRNLRERIMSLTRDGRGYLSTIISDSEGRRYHMTAYKAVALAFLGETSRGKTCICHNDGNKDNNTELNLRWCSYLENSQDAIKHGSVLIGILNPRSVLIEDQVKEIRSALEGGEKLVRLAEKYGVSRTNIRAIRDRKIWKHL